VDIQNVGDLGRGGHAARRIGQEDERLGDQHQPITPPL
jgi:hypothetical protein